MEKWSEFYPMIEDIQRHVAATGETVVSADDRITRTVGFETQLFRWEIWVGDVSLQANRHIDGYAHRRNIRDLIRNPSSRAMLAERLSAGAVELLPKLR